MKIWSSLTSLKSKEFCGNFFAFMRLTLSWLSCCENMSSRQSSYSKGFLLTYILNHIAEITIEFFRYDIRIITDSASDVQHLTFIITLRFIINKWFYGISKLPGIVFMNPVTIFIENAFIDFAFNFVAKFRILRNSSQSCFCLPFL